MQPRCHSQNMWCAKRSEYSFWLLSDIFIYMPASLGLLSGICCALSTEILSKTPTQEEKEKYFLRQPWEVSANILGMVWHIYVYLQVLWGKQASSCDDLTNICVLLYFFLPWILGNNSWEQSSNLWSLIQSPLKSIKTLHWLQFGLDQVLKLP